MHIMLMLTAEQAARVRGRSARHPSAVLAPVALAEGRYAVPATVLEDPAHEPHHEMLGRLPSAPIPDAEITKPRTKAVAIIGAGFSGTMLAVHLVEMSASPLKVILFDKSSSFAKGPAYATPNAKHLLNVRATNMSAYASDPGHFVRWLANDDAARRQSVDGFVSRGIYGRYLRATLEAACLAARSAHVVEVEAQVSDLAIGESGVELSSTDGRRFAVDCAALCIGNLPQALPIQGQVVPERYIAVPWTPHVLDRIHPNDTVGILGTGLTMVDVVLDIRSRGHKGRITALSRHGLLPMPHRTVEPYPPFLSAESPPKTIRQLLGIVRDEVRGAAQRGIDWRAVIDAMRGQTDSLWRNLPLEERKRFLRHVRPYWEVHRHRVAPGVAEEIKGLCQSGDLGVIAGRIVSLTGDARRISLTVRRRSDRGERELGVNWLVNCSGPQLDYERAGDPLVKSLFASGLAHPDPLKLGLQVSHDYRVVGRGGAPSPVLFALGPPIRGSLWETTAVPDIRRQCEALARHITGHQVGALAAPDEKSA